MNHGQRCPFVHPSGNSREYSQAGHCLENTASQRQDRDASAITRPCKSCRQIITAGMLRKDKGWGKGKHVGCDGSCCHVMLRRRAYPERPNFKFKALLWWRGFAGCLKTPELLRLGLQLLSWSRAGRGRAQKNWKSWRQAVYCALWFSEQLHW